MLIALTHKTFRSSRCPPLKPRSLLNWFGILCIAGCSNLTSIKNEIPLASSELTLTTSTPSETKVLLFNSSDVRTFKIDGSGRMNISANGKGIGQLDIGQYLQVILPKGRHRFRLSHRDLQEFESFHELQLQDAESIIEICATATGNRARLRADLPDQFPSSFRAVDAGPAPSFDELFNKGYFELQTLGRRPHCNW